MKKNSGTKYASLKIHKFDLSTIPCLNSNILTRIALDRVVVLKLDTEKMFNITGIAADFWTQINGKRTIGTIMKQLAVKHQPPVECFEKDVKRFINDLMKNQLIELT